MFDRRAPLTFSGLYNTLYKVATALTIRCVCANTDKGRDVTTSVVSFILNVNTTFNMDFLVVGGHAGGGELYRLVSVVYAIVVYLLFAVFAFVPPLVPLFGSTAGNGCKV